MNIRGRPTRTHAEQLDRGDRSRSSRRRYQGRAGFRAGTDPRVSCLAASGFVLWFVGYPDSAVERANRGVALGGRARSLFARVRPVPFGVPAPVAFRTARSSKSERTELLELLADHDFPIWRALGTCLAGAATSLLGAPGRGPGPDRRRDASIPGDALAPDLLAVFLRFMQAACLAGAGRVADALDRARRDTRDHGRPFCRPPIFNLMKGDLLASSRQTRATWARSRTGSSLEHGTAHRGDHGPAPGRSTRLLPAPTRIAAMIDDGGGAARRLRPVHRGLRDPRLERGEGAPRGIQLSTGRPGPGQIGSMASSKSSANLPSATVIPTFVASRGGQKPRFDHAAAPRYSWMSPPSMSRRRTSRGLAGIGSPAAASG